jgi:hypothetical protein
MVENMVVVRRGGRYSARPYLFIQQAFGQIFKDDVNDFSSFSYICFMAKPPWLKCVTI